jgi:putative peptide zinc metalloprotease protein
MNILHSSSDALFALPTEALRDRLPQFDTGIIAREEVVEGKPMVVAMRKRAEGYYRINAEDWAMLQLFDGKRSYEEVAALYTAQTGQQCSAGQAREFAAAYRDTDFFYKTAAEKHIKLMEELRRNRRRRRHIDLAEIPILTWDAERYFDWLEPRLRFIFTRWFTLLTLAAFAWMAYIWAPRLGDMWADTVHFYNFTAKGIGDLMAFWLAFGFVVIIHESAHGLTARHWGATVKHMGFLLFYVAPTFYCDVSEAWIYGGKWQRILTAFAGAWSELMMCAVATFVWWGTAPGMFIHQLAYMIVIVAGIGLIVANLNPLIKLDGYYIFCELLGYPDLKERSTAYVSQWLRSVFGLPAEVPHLRPRRKWFFIVYAVLSGIYSYFLLLVVAHWMYNVFYRYTPEWAFVAGLAMALWIFRSPLRHFRDFMKTLCLDKKETWRKWLTGEYRYRSALAAAVLLVILFAPVWRETVDGRFLLEAPRRAVVRTSVPGNISEISVHEGQRVAAGAPIARLRNLAIESEAGRAVADYDRASARAVQAELHYANLGAAANDRDRAATLQQTAAEQLAQLQLASPIAGVVVTPRVRDLLGSYVPAGATIAEVEDPSSFRARVFVAEPFLHYLRQGAPAVLHLDDTFTTLRGTVEAILPASSGPPPEALIAKSGYKGLQLPSFYPVLVTIQNPRDVREGMIGSAKILVRRRSLVGLCWAATRDFFGRRFW